MATIDLGPPGDPLILLSRLRIVLALTVSWPSATESWEKRVRIYDFTSGTGRLGFRDW